MKHVNPFKHTTAEDYEHFLSYMWASGARHNALLCKAYFDGADAPHEEYEAYMTAHPEQAEQEPVGMILGGELVALVEEYQTGAWPIYAAPVQQAEQEPVAWMVTSEGLDGTPKTYPLTGRFKDVCDMCDFGDPIPLYAAPQPVKQEPVAWMHKATVEWIKQPRNERNQTQVIVTGVNVFNGQVPLYAAPVRTKDLTDDEILPDGYSVVTTYDGLLEFARAVIAKFKEKNK